MVKKEKERTGHYVGVVQSDKKSNARTTARKMFGTNDLELELMRTDSAGTKVYRVIVLHPKGK